MSDDLDASTPAPDLAGRLADGTLPRARVELAARLGDVDAAAALGDAAPPPGALDLYAWKDPTFPTLPVAEQVLVLAHALEALVRWWARDAQPPAEPRFLEPVVAAIQAATAWVAGPEGPRSDRALEAGRHVVRFFEVIPPDAGGLHPPTHERACTHLAYAAGALAYVAAPPEAPFRAPTPWEPAPPRPARNDDAERRARLDAARLESLQAIDGRAYLEALPREGDYEARFAARARAVRDELQRGLVARLLA